jgi:hypothetical protein
MKWINFSKSVLSIECIPTIRIVLVSPLFPVKTYKKLLLFYVAFLSYRISMTFQLGGIQ